MAVYILDKRAHYTLETFFRGPNGELFDSTTNTIGQRPEHVDRAQELANDHGVNITVTEVAETYASNWQRISKRVTKTLLATPELKKEV